MVFVAFQVPAAVVVLAPPAVAPFTSQYKLAACAVLLPVVSSCYLNWMAQHGSIVHPHDHALCAAWAFGFVAWYGAVTYVLARRKRPTAPGAAPVQPE